MNLIAIRTAVFIGITELQILHINVFKRIRASAFSGSFHVQVTHCENCREQFHIYRRDLPTCPSSIWTPVQYQRWRCQKCRVYEKQIANLSAEEIQRVFFRLWMMRRARITTTILHIWAIFFRYFWLMSKVRQSSPPHNIPRSMIADRDVRFYDISQALRSSILELQWDTQSYLYRKIAPAMQNHSSF